MSYEDKFITAETTLKALVRLLKNEGYDLNELQQKYNSQVLGNVLSGASPDYKLRSLDILDEAIKEA